MNPLRSSSPESRLSFLAPIGVALVLPALGCSSNAENVGTTGEQALVGDGLVISAVYGGGGNAGATFTNDFVEIFNRGTEGITLGGLSIQYGGKSSDFGQPVALPAVTLEAGKYFLIQFYLHGRRR